MCVPIQIKTVHLNVKSVKETMMVFLLRLLCILSDVLHEVKCVEHERTLRDTRCRMKQDEQFAVVADL